MGAIFSKLSSNLTNTGVQQPGPNGPTRYYANPQDATAAASRQLPSADAILGSDVLNPNTAAPPMPKVVQPNFSSAQDLPGALTSKGKWLSLALNGMLGAAAGDAAARSGDPRHGYAGLGAAALAGANEPLVLAGSRAALRHQQQEDQIRQNEIDLLPTMNALRIQGSQADLAEKQARTANYNAQMARRDNYTIPGVGLVNSDGKILVAEPGPGAAAQAQLNMRKAEAVSANMDPERTLEYVYGIKPTKDQVNEFAGYVQKAGGDVAKAVDLKRQADVQDKIAFHEAIQKADSVENGLSIAQQRQLMADPEYASLKQQSAALSGKLGTMQADQFADPKDIAAAQNAAVGLYSRMNAAKQRILKSGSGQSSPQYKVGDAVMYKGKPHVVTGFDKNGKLEIQPTGTQ